MNHLEQLDSGIEATGIPYAEILQPPEGRPSQVPSVAIVDANVGNANRLKSELLQRGARASGVIVTTTAEALTSIYEADQPGPDVIAFRDHGTPESARNLTTLVRQFEGSRIVPVTVDR